QLLSKGLMSRQINLDEKAVRGTIEVISKALTAPIFEGDGARSRDNLAPVLAFLSYLLDEHTEASIEPYAIAVYETVVRHTTPDRILAASNASSTRFVAYLLAAIGRYDEAREIVSVSTH